MRIALITIHWANNYGAALQVLSTQEVLEKFGEVTIIDYRRDYANRAMTLLRMGITFRDFLRLGKDVLRFFPRKRVIGKYRKFYTERLNLSKLIIDEEDFRRLENEFDVFISGGDQMWNPKVMTIKGELDARYFLDFVKTKKKISYASSKGSYEYSGTEEAEVIQYLSKYDFLSAREKESALYFSSLVKKDVKHVLDPTLLLSKNEWITLLDLRPPINFPPYIFVYSVKGDRYIKQVIQAASDVLKLKVITVDQEPFINYKADKQIRDAGPEEFLSLLLGAAFIVTNSFHGTAFSLNFNRPFVVTSPLTGGVNRIQSILTEMQHEERLVKKINDVGKALILEMDFDGINSKLDRLRVSSTEYLENALIN